MLGKKTDHEAAQFESKTKHDVVRQWTRYMSEWTKWTWCRYQLAGRDRCRARLNYFRVFSPRTTARRRRT